MYHHNPHQQARKQLRLKDYDHSKKGLYFITISVKDKLCIFGEIKKGYFRIIGRMKNYGKILVRIGE